MYVDGREAVGREVEQARIVSFLADAQDARALLLEGEPGIGKSVLLEVTADLAREQGWRVLSCRAAAAETGYAFAALGDLVEPVVEEVLPSLPDPQRDAVAAALGRAAGRGADERLVGLAFLSILRGLALDGPVLVAVDDVQWLDRSSAAALRFAVRRLTDENVTLVATARTGEDSAALADRVESLEIGPLSMGALHRIVALQVGSTLPRPVMRQVFTVSGGNPFYALEIARFLVDQDVRLEAGEELPIPRTLDQLVQSRLDRLSAGARELLELAAMLAEPDTGLLAAAGGPTECLDEAVQAGVLVVAGQRVRFSHPLLAAGVVARCGPNRRRELHAGLAAIVPDPEERARHSALASDGPSSEVAGLLDEAAERAGARGAPAVSADLFELAARLTPDGAGSERIRRLIRAAEQHGAAADLRRERSLLEPLVAELPPGEQRAKVVCMLATSWWDDFTVGLPMLEQALDEAAVDDEWRARILLALVHMTSFVRGAGEALTRAREGLAAADACGDERLIRIAACRLAFYEVTVGERTAGLLERAIQLAQAPVDVSQVEFAADGTLPVSELAITLVCHDRVDEARQLFDRSIAAERELGLELPLMQDLMHMVTLECRAGNWDRARACARECSEISERIGYEFQGGLAFYATALMAAYLGDSEEARQAAERGIEISTEIGDDIFLMLNKRVLGFLELSEGNMQAAADRLEPLVRQLEERDWREPSLFDVKSNAIEALLATGRVNEAIRLTGDLEDWGRTMDSPWARANGARCRGLVREATGDAEGALLSFGEALAECEQLPMPFDRGRTLLALGVAQRRLKQKRAARESLTEAADVFDRLGAKLWAARARAELRRIGGRSPARLELTETERRVAELAAVGRRNTEVAAELHISVRSVEWNLSKVYAKLGIRSRTELARNLPA